VLVSAMASDTDPRTLSKGTTTQEFALKPMLGRVEECARPLVDGMFMVRMLLKGIGMRAISQSWR